MFAPHVERVFSSFPKFQDLRNSCYTDVLPQAIMSSSRKEAEALVSSTRAAGAPAAPTPQCQN